MKKSKKLFLALMGALALAGCGGSTSEAPHVFKDKAECVASGRFNQEQCEKMEADAKAQTPQFASREECVKQFGENACKQENVGHGSIWMPMLMGFMAGQMLSGGNAASAQGLYQNPTGNGYQTAKGAPVVNKPVVAPKASPLGRSVSRGGFSSGGRAIGA